MGLFRIGKKQENGDTASRRDDSIQAGQELLPARAPNIEMVIADLFVPDASVNINEKTTMSFPIAELSTLGTAAASLLPKLRTVTETMTVDSPQLYRLANTSIGDTLKKAKDGNFWAAFKKTDGGSKMVKLQEAGPINVTSTKVMPVDPTTIMVAAALYTIEKKLDEMAEVQKQILSFLENEKEAQIEADAKILEGSIKEFKFNWDKDVFVSGHYKQALDIKRTAEKNLQSYQKDLQEINVKAPVIMNANVSSVVNDLLRKFRYYRMSLYLYAKASFVEVMLLGDFREDHILKIKEDVEERSMRYRQIYGACSAYIERIAGKAVEGNVLKGIGSAGKALGGLIGSIPLIKEGPVDEWLIGGGDTLKKNAKSMEDELIHALYSVSSPETGIFIDKVEQLGKICNHTSEICIDKESIYLVAS